MEGQKEARTSSVFKGIIAATLLVLIGLTPVTAFGGNRNPAKARVDRSKALDFEDEVVEGMNKNPLDSVEAMAKRDSRDKARLYRKRPDYRKEMKETVREMGYSP
jgi:hypothetical protein